MFHRVFHALRKSTFASIITRPQSLLGGFCSSVPRSSLLRGISRFRRPLSICAGSLALTATFTGVYCYPKKDYVVIAGPGLEAYGKQLAEADPDHFRYIPVKWDKFPDGTDFIKIDGFSPRNLIRDSNVLFVASFHNNNVSMSQYHALCMLCESFIKSMTVFLPFIPQCTMERVTEEGVIATANTTARLFNNLPSVGMPARVMVYDLHTLQNRFFFCNNALATLHTTFPLLIEQMKEPSNNITCVAFPDDGSEKRFGHIFKEAFPHMEVVTCGKKRSVIDPSLRDIVIKDGNPSGSHVVIVDDLVRSGGTLAECAKALKEKGATDVSCFVAHAVFPNDAWKKFTPEGKYEGLFKNFWVTNTNPTVSNNLPKEHFTVLDVIPQFLRDL